MANKSQKLKQTLDKMTTDDLQGSCDHRANTYERHGFLKQAKKLRDFKKRVRLLMGTL